MKNTVFTVIFSLLSTGCAFFAMVYPAWFQQEYRRDGNNVFQGYGIFAFYSTNGLESPFYASKTTLQYGTFCASKDTPNYMLGNGDQFHQVLCGKAMTSVQATTATGAGISVLGLIASIIAVFNPSAGIPEKIVSFSTLVGSLLLAGSLVIWGWSIQQRLYQVDSVASAYSGCKADKTDWSCWFYGYSFWVCLASVILMSITGYLSSAGRAEKIRYFRKEYERDLAIAVQASLENDTATQAHQLQGPPTTTGYVRTNTSQGFGLQSQPPPLQQYPGQQVQQPSYPPPAPMPSYTSASSSHSSQYSSSHHLSSEATFPTFREQRSNHSLLGRQPSGGVV